jgi:opacity protein-like surface antigen
MNFATRLLAVRRGALPVSAALLAGLFGSSSAWAQCVSTLPPAAAIFFPYVQNGMVNSLVSSINMVNTAFLTQSTAFVSAPGNPKPDQQGGGAWGRIITGSADTDTRSNSVADLTAAGLGAGTTNCSTTTRTDYTGVQVGQDISVLNGGASGANFHVGVTAGYVQADSKDKSPGATFSNTLDVPFFGVYAAFTRGGFFMDGQARWDAYQNEVTDPALGFSNQQFNAHGWSLTGNVGYNIPLHGNWFVEPSGGVIWSNVKVDPLNVAGPPGIILPARVDIDDIESILGRASVRVGTNITAGHILLQPFFTASVFHEFAGDVHTRISANNFGGFVGPAITADVNTSRVGTYGQFALGSAAAIANTGWLGYARFDYRIGEDIQGWSVNVGLRYQFTPDQRSGGLKDAGVRPVYAYNWTGPYIGAYAGKDWATQNWSFVGFGSTSQTDYAGYIVGGQAGYNVQFGRVVVGVEGSYGGANSHGGAACPNAAFFTCDAELNTMATVTGRVGVTWERALFYGKGGWAGGDVGAGAHLNLVPNPGAFADSFQETKWQNGWIGGIGMEFALTDRWSARAEYLHYDLGGDRFQISANPASFADVTTRGDMVTVGLNLHFNPTRAPEPLK